MEKSIVNKTPSSQTPPDPQHWLEQEGWLIGQSRPCCPPATATFHAVSPCGRLIVHSAEPYENGFRSYRLSPADGGWSMTVPEAVAVAALAAEYNALDRPSAPYTARRSNASGQTALKGVELSDLALKQDSQGVATVSLFADEYATSLLGRETRENR